MWVAKEKAIKAASAKSRSAIIQYPKKRGTSARSAGIKMYGRPSFATRSILFFVAAHLF